MTEFSSLYIPFADISFLVATLKILDVNTCDVRCVFSAR
jgi:hypothetical protein